MGDVAEGHWAFGRRVVVEDVRRNDTFMRVTWHDDAGVFVVSHWRGDVCVAATRIPVEAAPDLVNLLVRGLAASSATAPVAAPPSRRRTILERIREAVRGQGHAA
jgi:hypothetical protein